LRGFWRIAALPARTALSVGLNRLASRSAALLHLPESYYQSKAPYA